MDTKEFKEKLRSLSFAQQSKRGPKVTTDVHDHHEVQVTEHWNDRVDVNVKVPTIKVKTTTEEGY